MVKIVTYNVNGIRQRIAQFGSLLKLLDSLDADIICFQEIKVTRQELTADLIVAEGYESFFSCTRTTGKGRTGYSGVATFCRVKSAFSSSEVALPVAAEEGFTGLLDTSCGTSGKLFSDMECIKEFQKEELLKIDSEGRCVITDHGHFVLFNVYGPRADPEDAERIQFKANFFKIMQMGIASTREEAYNCCGFRRWFRSQLVKNGGSFYDLFREKNPERTDAYTCWPVHTGAEEFNYGSRIDHILGSGVCLHQLHGNDDHNLVKCHVEECDIITEFKRWKPGSSSRWKGGRATKLEGSDHAPVFVVLKDIPEIEMHCTPPFSARYMPEIRGSQQTIVSILMKRQMTQRVDIVTPRSPDKKGDIENVNVEGSAKGALNALSSPMKTCENVTSSCAPKKKMKQNQQGQLSLMSFFSKIPSNGEPEKNLTKNGSDNQESNCNAYECAKDNTDTLDKEGNIDESDPSREHNRSTATECFTEGDKKSVLMEWQRIQQLMQDSIPLCERHKEPCVSRVVKKAGPNLGRRFFVCARAEGPSSNPETRCDFFRWAGTKPRQKK